ncbi:MULTISPECIES: hypothetical protein [unclassified Agrococcus]|uniref:hypothetical protein n=1 Tax=unclassified Agrococcus TaxID=2615065 RepID=UPI00360B18CF
MSTVEQQRRPNGPAAITGVVLFIGGIVMLFNGVPPLLGTIGQLASYAAFMGIERAIESLLPYAILPLILTIGGLIAIRAGFGVLRTQGRKGAGWARSEWQQHQPEVQQRFQSAREQLQAQGGGAWQQAQQRAQQQAPAWSGQQQARQGWPGQPQQAGGQRAAWQGQQQRVQPPPPQPAQRQQPSQQRGQSTLERMQQRIADAPGAVDRARDAAMAQHDRQAAELQRRAARAADAARDISEGLVEHSHSFGTPALVAGRRSSSILASSSLRSTSLRGTSLSLESLRLRR